MAISKVASRRLLCCVPTLYVYMSKCCFINVKSKHEERLIFDRLFVRVFLYVLLLCVKYYIPERKSLRIFEDPSYIVKLFDIVFSFNVKDNNIFPCLHNIRNSYNI